MPTKTIVIWDTCGLEAIRFFVVDQSITRMDGVYINQTDLTDEQSDEINSMMCHEDGQYKVEMLYKFPLEIAREEGVCVIVMGFLP